MDVRRGRLKRVIAGVVAAGLLAGCGSTAAPASGSAGTTKGSTAGSTAGSTPAAAAPSNKAAQVHLLESGSSLLYPLFNIWVPAYTKNHPGLRIDTASTGSGTGIADATKGIVQIGASDAYLPAAKLKQTPGLMNIPLGISAQQINYNLPGLNKQHLKLSGPVLAGIYEGQIKYWDNAQIAQMNPGVKLPHHQIIPVHRSDGSGDSFLFSQFLTFTTPSWKSKVGFSTSPSWPAVPLAVGAKGNQGMVQALKQTPYAIAYVGISWLDKSKQAGLGEAELKNKAGNFELPVASTIQGAANALDKQTPTDESISLIFAPGANAYPIINYEYAIVNAKQSSPAVGSALKAFLSWAISPSGGNSAKFLNQVHFVPLPSSIRTLSQNQINKIS